MTHVLGFISSCIIFLVFCCPVYADVVYFETNNWDLNRKITWTANLEILNENSDLAVFVYYDEKGKQHRLSVHKTRIYEILFNDKKHVAKPFPKTRSSIQDPLPTNPRRSRIVKININEQTDFVSRLPKNYPVRYQRDKTIAVVNGFLKSIDGHEAQLEIQNGNDTIRLPIKRTAMVEWEW